MTTNKTTGKAKAAAAKAKPRTPSSPPTKAANATLKTPAGKLGLVVDLLRRPQGATLAQMGEATGWQAHSVRGALAGALKKKHGLAITSQKEEAGRVYRIVAGKPA